MSDPRQDAELTLDGTTYILRFTNSALVHLEKLTGQPVPQLGLVIMSGNFGFDTLTSLVTAGLEGARRKLRLGGKPWTKDTVAELLEDAENFDQVAEPAMDAFQAALERWFPAEQEPSDPPPAAGSGTTSSEPPSEQD